VAVVRDAKVNIRALVAAKACNVNSKLHLAIPALQMGALSPSSVPVAWLLKHHFPCQREHPFGATSVFSDFTAAALGSSAALALLHSLSIANMVSEVQALLWG
jgi:hypothetical protein